MTKEIAFSDAVIGGEIEVNTIDKKTLRINILNKDIVYNYIFC